jgi:DMSO/TMAO reductase YedYZ heme-binding membrane subunit
VLTSYFRRVFGRHRWKQLHYAAYAAAAVFYVHGVLADPLLKNRPPDFIDAEKVYVEGCALLAVASTTWRFRSRERRAAPRGRAVAPAYSAVDGTPRSARAAGARPEQRRT